MTEGLGPEIASAHIAVTASFRGVADSVRKQGQAAGRDFTTAFTTTTAAGARAAGANAGDEFQSAFGLKIKDAFKNVFLYGGAYAAIGGIQQLLSAAGHAAIGFNSTLEQTNIAFETLLGSSARAQHELAWLKTFARETPFQFQNLTIADQQLIAMGFSARNAHDALLAVGDAAAGLGRGEDTVNRMVLALGQIQTKGRVMGDDLRQLQEAGVPALKILAAQFGVSASEMQKMISKGQVLANRALPALVSGIENGTKATKGFAGQMERQSHTFAGAVSNIEDSLTQLTAAVGKPIFTELSSSFQGFADELNSPDTQEAIRGLTTIVDLLTKTEKGLTSVAGAFGPQGKQLKDSLGFVGFLKDNLKGLGNIDLGVGLKKFFGIAGQAPAAAKALGLVSDAASDTSDAIDSIGESVTIALPEFDRFSDRSLDLKTALTDLRKQALAAGLEADKTLTPAMVAFGKAAGLTALQAESVQGAMAHVSDGTTAFVAALDARTAAVLGLAQAQAVLIGTQYAVDRASGGASAQAVGGELAKVQGVIGQIKSYQTLVPQIPSLNGSGGSKSGSKSKYDPWAAFLKAFNSSHAKAYVNASGKSVAKFLVEGFGDELNKQGKLTVAGLGALGVEKWSAGAAKHIKKDFEDAFKSTRSKIKDIKGEIKSGEQSFQSTALSGFFGATGSTDFFGNTIKGSTGAAALALATSTAARSTQGLADEGRLNNLLGPKYNDFLNSLLASGNFAEISDLANSGNGDLARQIGDAFNITQQAATQMYDNSPQGKKEQAQLDKLTDIAATQHAMVNAINALAQLQGNGLSKAQKHELLDNLNGALKALKNSGSISKIGK